MKSENVKERPLTKLDEYAILISKHWKRSKTGVDGCDPTSILVNFKKDIKEVIKNELISDGWTKQVWHSVKDGDLPDIYKEVLCYDGENYIVCKRDNIDWYDTNEICYNIVAWTDLPKYKE